MKIIFKYCKPTTLRLYFTMNLFAATNFHDKTLSTPAFYIQLNDKCWSTAKNIRANEALANIAKISPTRIKVGFGSGWDIKYENPIMCHAKVITKATIFKN